MRYMLLIYSKEQPAAPEAMEACARDTTPGLDEAIEIASKIPAARYGSIEVRPIQTFS